MLMCYAGHCESVLAALFLRKSVQNFESFPCSELYLYHFCLKDILQCYFIFNVWCVLFCSFFFESFSSFFLLFLHIGGSRVLQNICVREKNGNKVGTPALIWSLVSVRLELFLLWSCKGQCVQLSMLLETQQPKKTTDCTDNGQRRCCCVIWPCLGIVLFSDRARFQLTHCAVTLPNLSIDLISSVAWFFSNYFAVWLSANSAQAVPALRGQCLMVIPALVVPVQP